MISPFKLLCKNYKLLNPKNQLSIKNIFTFLFLISFVIMENECFWSFYEQ